MPIILLDYGNFFIFLFYCDIRIYLHLRDFELFRMENAWLHRLLLQRTFVMPGKSIMVRWVTPGEKIFKIIWCGDMLLPLPAIFDVCASISAWMSPIGKIRPSSCANSPHSSSCVPETVRSTLALLLWREKRGPRARGPPVVSKYVVYVCDCVCVCLHYSKRLYRFGTKNLWVVTSAHSSAHTKF